MMFTKKNLLLLVLFSWVMVLVSAGTSPATAQTPTGTPNLAPYTPSGWSFPIVPSSVQGTNTVNTLYTGQPTYIDLAMINNGTSRAWGKAYICLYLDGVEIGQWYASHLRPNYYATVIDWSYTVNNAGTHTLRIVVDCTNRISESNENDNSWEMAFTWQSGGGGGDNGIIISDQQGFDKCEIPSTSQMQTWWNSSPYYEVNLYIGGSARACSNSGLNASWVSTVSAQGWNFIPTWVGPQAPCTGYSSRFSSDPTTAYSQGRAEANSAVTTATNLGLISAGRYAVIYYDLEAFPDQSSCRTAAKSFLNGWVERLNELGHRAGIYGSACGSYVTDWATIANVPDDVWPAHWIYSTYNANATVWSVACVADSYWSNHQRIRQYAGGHNETYGGVTFNIDSNALDGHVAGVNPRVLSPVQWVYEGVAISDLQRLNETQGWLLQNNQLLWTNDAGTTWQEITPALVENRPIVAAYFVDSQQGWVVMPADVNRLTLFSTQDAGKNWHASDLTLFAPNSGQSIAAVSVQFLNAQQGWLVVKLGSGVNFSLGLLFYTPDGGQSWEQGSLPVAGAVKFENAQVGELTGGTTGLEQYRTIDGGQSWTFVGTATPEWGNVGLDGVTKVTWGNAGTGWATTVTNSCAGNKLASTNAEPFRCLSQSALWSTTNSGSSWQKVK